MFGLVIFLQTSKLFARSLLSFIGMFMPFFGTLQSGKEFDSTDGPLFVLAIYLFWFTSS